MSKCFPIVLAVGLLIAASSPAVAQRGSKPSSAGEATNSDETSQLKDQAAFFESRILPILVSRCYECHSQDAEQVEGGLRLDSRAGMQHGGDSGPAVVPGSESQSLVLAALTSTDNPMPPDGPLDANIIADFRTWIARGAFDPREPIAEQPEREPDYSKARDTWAFRAVQPPRLPKVQAPEWCLTPIDYFILSRLEAAGLGPAPAANPELLLRRVTFDLTGLPPTPEEIRRFVENPTDEAYREIVDQLLSSPHYGERQAQHWLDVVRFAETEGFEYDRLMPGIWRYRDYVIEAFNSDKPYDLFLLEQLAGDELAENISGTDNSSAVAQRQQELRIAAGFHRLGAVRRNAGNQAVASSRNEVLTERTDIIGSAVLGLTVGCARCHDHKFDPIPQRDYYRLQAYVATTHEDNISLRDDAEQARLVAIATDIQAKIDALKEELSGLTGDAERRVRDKLEQLEARLPPPGPTICSVKNDPQNSAPIHLLKRGDPELAGPQVGMRNLGVLTTEDAPELPFGTLQPRTRLAHELVSPQHPLTARVMVNRIWQQHFGAGLVSTANDFGKNGDPPSHPELLDYLAHRFMSNGWHIKSLHRAIVTSRVYLQSSSSSDVADESDPQNRLLSHFSRRRLSGEEIRDAMLSIAGTLTGHMGGESVILPVEQELVDQLYKPSQWEVSRDEQQHHRRSIYLLAKRNLRLPFLEVFDQPSAQTSCAVREQSTHARQALELLNGPIANELSAAFAQRLVREVGSNPQDLVRRAYLIATAREPSETELRLSQRFIQDVGLGEFCLAVINLNSFLYVD